MDEATNYCLDRLRARGFDKAQVQYSVNERDELQAELGRPSLFRTVSNAALVLTGIVDGKRANVTLNDLETQEIDQAVDSLWLSAQASVADDANDIAEDQPPQSFTDGVMTPDTDTMYDRLEEFLAYTAKAYPTVTMGVASVSHLRARHTHANSFGVRFQSSSGCYQSNAHFSAKEGQDVSSLNGTHTLSFDLDTPIARTGSFDRLLKGSAEQVRTRKVCEGFVGDLIMTPDSTGAFLGFLVEHISRGPMVAGTSLYKDKFDAQVACPALTLRSLPCSRPGGYRITDDCFPAEDVTVVDRGVLRSYLLDLYSARKTGLDRSPNVGGWFSIDAGTTPLNDMVADVERGILIGRFSGGRPSANGDFSGIAKNSYYIENGVVRYPISETMVSGNMARLLLDISAVSTERSDFGTGAFPWMRTSNITVS